MSIPGIELLSADEVPDGPCEGNTWYATPARGSAFELPLTERLAADFEASGDGDIAAAIRTLIAAGHTHTDAVFDDEGIDVLAAGRRLQAVADDDPLCVKAPALCAETMNVWPDALGFAELQDSIYAIETRASVHAEAQIGQSVRSAMRLLGYQPAPAPKVGRNAPCPCGSARKYKHCHDS